MFKKTILMGVMPKYLPVLPTESILCKMDVDREIRLLGRAIIVILVILAKWMSVDLSTASF